VALGVDCDPRQAGIRPPRAFPLDPLHLPWLNVRTTFSTTNRFKTLGAIFDAAPDAWGRTVMRLDKGEARAAESESLIKGKGMGVGAILFSNRLLAVDAVQKRILLPEIARMNSLSDLIAVEKWNSVLSTTQIPGSALPFIGIK